jgi:hypothetical protein
MARPEVTGKRFLRKQSVADRYDVNERTVDRMAKDGRIPLPKYLPGSRIPIWDTDELDQNDLRAARERVPAGRSSKMSA